MVCEEARAERLLGHRQLADAAELVRAGFLVSHGPRNDVPGPADEHHPQRIWQCGLRTLSGELESSINVLKRISKFYDGHVGKTESKTRSVENAIILSDIVVNFYTCAETAFFRISQFFENTLNQKRWHRDMLKKMTLTIPGIRKRVISDDTFRDLEELLRSRHFKRYYFEFDYDWDRLELLRTKFLSVRRRLIDELTSYEDYLETLAGEADQR